MGIKSDEVTHSVRHENETNTFLHHLIDVSCETAQLYKALKDGSLCKLMEINPVNAWLKFCKDAPGRFKDNIVDLSLLLGELSINWEGNCHIRTVMIERVSLIGQHRLPVNQRLIVILVVQCGCSWATSTDR